MIRFGGQNDIFLKTFISKIRRIKDEEKPFINRDFFQHRQDKKGCLEFLHTLYQLIYEYTCPVGTVGRHKKSTQTSCN